MSNGERTPEWVRLARRERALAMVARHQQRGDTERAEQWLALYFNLGRTDGQQ